MQQRSRVQHGLRALGLGLAFVASGALAAVGVNKTFNPTNVSAGQTSTLTVILLNNNASPATAVAFTDNLPGTVVVATPANTTTTCGATVTATSGVGNFSVSGGTIPAASGGIAGQCTVTVDVMSPSAGVFINIIPAGAVSSSQGTNPQNANATLTVAALQPVTGAKSFLPATLHGGGGTSTVTLTLTNPNGVALTNASLTDTLPVASLKIASPPNATTTCGAGAVGTGANTATLTGGTIPANGSCTIKFDVVAANPNVYVDGNVANTIPIGALSTTQGVSNAVAFAANVRLQTGARVEKVFAPTPITTGGTSTLTVTVRNFNTTPLVGSIAFTDTFPAGMSVAAPVVTGTTCVGLAFTPVPVAGNTAFTVSGGGLPGATAGSTNNANCTVTINVTATNAGANPVTLNNTIPVGNFGGVGFSSGTGSLVVKAVTSVGGSKSFAPTPILQGGVSTLTITLTNSAAVAATITSFTDALTTLGANPQFTVAAAPPATTTCGGVLNAAPGANTITLGAGNSIPAGGNCTITVPVQASATASTGARTNSIAQGALVTSQGRTQAAISGVLTVNPVLSVAKAFAPLTVAAGTDTRATITLTRAAGAVALSGLAFTDTLPVGHLVSATPNLVNNCGGAVTATSGTNTITLAGGALAVGAGATSCTILVNVTTPAGAGSGTNTIAAGAVSSAQGFVNPAAASATVTRVVTSVTVNKSFNPATVLVGGTSQLTINIINTNANAIALTGGALTDTLPVGMAVAAAPGATNTCGGTFTPLAGATSVSLTNASIAANVSCRVQVNVVANAAGNLINPLAAGTFTSAQGVTNPLPAAATLAATGVANLGITKTDSVASVVPGTSTTYTIVASNAGPNAVAGASVVDNPPAGLTFTSWTCAASVGSSCGNASGSGPINELVSLLNAGTATYTVIAAIAPGATGTITNTVTVTVPPTVVDPTPANNTASDTDTLTPLSALAVSKTDGSATYTPGGSATYTVVVINAGPSNAINGTVSDPLPAGVTLSANATCVAAGTANCGTVTGTTGQTSFGTTGATVGAGAGNSLTFTVPVAFASGLITNPLINTVTATDPTSPPASASDSDARAAVAALVVSKTDGSPTYTPGGAATYTVVVTNAGPSNASSVTVSDPLPAGVTLSANATCVSSGAATCGVVTGTTGQTSFGTTGATIAAGAGNSVTFTAPVSFASGMLTNPLVNTVTATDPASPAASASDSDARAAVAALSVTKTDGSATYTPGGAATYTVTVTNAGPSNANSVTVSDPLPAGVTLSANAVCVASGTATCGTVTGTTGQTSFGTTGATIPAGAANKLTFTAPVAFASGMSTNPLVNTATGTDPASPPATGSDSDTLAAVAALAVTKTDGSATYTPGGTATYTVVVTNAGPSNAGSVTLSDPLPAGVTLTANVTCAAAGSASCGTVTGTTGQTSFGTTGATIAAGAGNSLTYTAPVSFAAGLLTNPLVNTATATDPSSAPAIGSDSDARAAVAALAVTKTDGSATYTPGGIATYTVVVTNAGPSNANSVTLSDPLPAGVTLSANATCVASGTANCGTVTGTTGQTSFGTTGATIAGGAANKLTFTVPVAFASGLATNPLVNTATATDPASPPASGSDSDARAAVAALSVTKTDGSATYTPGGSATYTVVVTNTGPSNANSMTMSDPLPAGVTLSANATCVASGASNCGAVTGTTGQASFGTTGATVVAGAGNQLTFTVPVSFAPAMTTNPLVNTATATDPASPPATGSDSDTLSAQVSLNVVKTDGSATYTPGGTATYTITVTNGGPSSATNVTVTDALPAGVTLSANATCVAGGTATCGTVTGTTGQTSFGTTSASIGAGAANKLVFTVPVAFAASMVADPIINSATATDLASSGTGSTATGTDTDSRSATVSLSVVKTDGSVTYTPGGNATYTVTVTNGGPSVATNMTITDPLPAGVTLTANATCVASGTATCGAVTGTTGQASFGTTGATLGAAAADKLVFTVPVAFASSMITDPLVNTATVTDLGASGAGSTATGSDSDARAASVTLLVSKTDGASTYTPGGTATYTVTVENAGTSDALDVTVTDALPAGLTLTANAICVANGTSGCGTVTGTTGQTSFGTTGAAIVPGGANTIVFTIPVAFGAGMSTDPLVNTATATDVPTGATANGSDSDTLSSNVTLAVAKTDGSATYTPGGTATYTVTVVNTGLSDALDVNVTDALPAGVTLGANATCVANGSSSCGTVTGATGQTSFGATAANVNAGGANTLVFTVPVAFASGMTTTPLVNTAMATDVASGNTASGSDSDTLSAVVTLGVGKTDGSATYTPGGTATYTVTVANTGLSDALDVTVTDPLPVGVTLNANAACVAGGTSSCGTVTGTTGQTSFGATTARIDAGAANAIVFTVPVAFAAAMTTTPLINTATATDIPTGITANGSDSDVLSANVSLAVTKTDGSATYTPGGTASYTVTVANTGVSDALDVTVTDPLPAGVTLNANAICVANGTSSCGTVTGTTGQTSFGTTAARVDAGGANTLTFTVPVAFAAGMNTNPLVNTASATDVASGATANGADSDALASNVTLGVTKTDGSATYTPGGTATYVVTVTNTGVSDALDVTVMDPLPAGVTLNANASCVASGSSSCGTVTGTTGQAGFGTTAARVSVGAGNALVFTVPVAFAPGMSTNPLVNTATANDVPTGATASGSDSDTLVAAAGLAVTKTDGSATYTPGGTATYTVVVTNGGPSNAANLTVTDNLPAGVTLGANATCVATGAATCGAVTGATGATSFGTTAATLAAGAGNALTFTVPVNFSASLATDPLINTVTASDPAAPGPVSASDSDTRAPVADVGIVKTGPATLIAGSAITYTLTLTNAGPSAANGATFNDNVPAIIGGVAASCGSAAGGATCGAVSVVGNTVSGIVPFLPVGGSVVITITGNVSGTAAGSITNIGTISPPIGTSDPTPGNSSSSVTTTVGATTANQVPVNAPWALALLLAAIGLFGALHLRSPRAIPLR